LARLIAGVGRDVDAKAFVSGKDGVQWISSLDPLFAEVVKLGDFDGEAGKSLVVYGSRLARRAVLAGAGDEEWYGWVEALRIGVAAAVRAVVGLKNVKSVAVSVEPRLVERALGEGGGSEWVYEQAMVAGDMAAYRFVLKKEDEGGGLEEIVFPEAPSASAGSAEAIALGVKLARDVANMPASRMNPEGIEEEARRIAGKYGLTLRVLHRGELESLGMGGVLAVGMGSSVEPRLIVLEYDGGGPSLAVVGKTVTFDSGGLDIKPSQAMLEMKYDKSGGAAALGAAVAAALLKLPVKLTVLLPAVENMPSGSSYKPLDVIEMYNGLRVEVGNTDAEGRLTLADALAYAAEKYKPKALLDLATLTGAAVIALGNHAAALMSNNEELARLVEKAAWRAGEPVWKLPMWKVYGKQLESKVADINNIGGRAAGPITAAKFLEKFVGETPWVHLDIAGVAWVQEKGPWKPYYQQGATGWGVRTIIEAARLLAA